MWSYMWKTVQGVWILNTSHLHSQHIYFNHLIALITKYSLCDLRRSDKCKHSSFDRYQDISTSSLSDANYNSTIFLLQELQIGELLSVYIAYCKENVSVYHVWQLHYIHQLEALISQFTIFNSLALHNALITFIFSILSIFVSSSWLNIG